MHDWKHVHDGSVPCVIHQSWFPLLGSQDPRDEIQGGQWRGVVGGIHFAGEALAGGYSRGLVRNQKNGCWNWRQILGDPMIVSSRFVCMGVFSDSIPSFSSPWWPSKSSLQSLSLWSFFTFYLRLLTDSSMFKHSFYILSYLVISCHHPWYE